MKASLVSICERIINRSFNALIFLTPLLVCPWTYELFEFPKMIFVYAMTITAVFPFLIKMILKSRHTTYDIRHPIPHTPLNKPIILYSLFFILSTIFSAHRYTSIFGYYSRFHGGLLSLLCYVALFYIYIAEFRDKPKEVLVTCYLLFVTALLVSLYGILQHLGIDRGYWVQDSQARVFSTLGQPNWLSAWLLMILPLSWAFYLSSKPPALITFNLVLSTILFASFWFTYSLSGILGFLVMVAVFVVLVSKKILLENKKRISLLVISYLLIVTSSPGLFAPRMKNLWENITQASQVLAAEAAPPLPGGDTAQIRRLVWQGALNLWRSSPKNILLGTGPETFAYAFLTFRPVELNQTSEWDFLYNKAHNEYLDILCGTGILGLGAYLFLIGKFLWWGIEKIKNQSAPGGSKIKTTTQNSKVFNTKYLILDTGYLLPAILSGWVSLLVTNFFGFSIVPTALLFWLYPAICFAFFF